MHRKRWAAFALVALLPALAVCVDGMSPPIPTDQAAQLVLAPVFATETGSGEPLPINAIRVTALLSPGDEVLTRQTFPVDPAQDEWTLALEIPYSSELEDPRFYTVMELLNVSGGVETVEWSGRSRIMELSGLSQLEVQAVEVVRGPVANLDVTGVSIEPHDSLFEEGASATVSAGVEGSEAAVVYWESSDPAVATVARSGSREARVSFLRPGAVSVTARAGTEQATTRFRAVQRPDSVVFLPGASLRLTSLQDTARLRAVLVDPRGDSIPGEPFAWSVPEGAPVRHLGGGAFLALSPGVVTVTVRPDRAPDLEGAAELTVAQVARSVDASPAGLFLPEVGATATVTATAADARGFPVEEASFSFRSLDDAVATVDGQGRITGVASGITGVVVSLDGAADTVGVTVSEALDRIDVTPASHTFTRAGDTLRYRAVAVARDGTPIPSLTGFLWAVDDEAVASVDAEGLVLAVEDGRATVSASLDDVAGHAEVVVERVPGGVLVSPATVRLEALGETARLTAVVVDAAGDTLRLRGVSWSSANPAVARVSEDGTVTAMGNGTARIEARAGEVVGAATVSVAQELAAVALRPDSLRLDALGTTGQLQAMALDAAGAEMAAPAFAWVSSDTSVVRVDATGTFTSVGNGTARISATADGVSGSAPVVVEQVAHRVEVDPPSFTFTALGLVHAFDATVFDENDHEMVADELVWSSSDTLVVRVTQEGEASAEMEGTAVLSVETHGVTGSAELTVAPERTVAEIVLAPETHAFTGRGQTRLFTATALDGAGDPLPDPGPFAWSSTDGSVVSVAPDGTATAVAPGSATVRATLDGVFGEAAVSVKVPVASVEVTPAAHTFTRAGETLALEAVVRDADGFVVPSAAGFLWRSDALAVVRVGADGVAEAVSDGSATVTASHNGIEGSAALTVARVVESVVIEPEAPAPLTFFGQTRSLRARVYDAAGELILEPAAWRSLDAGVATVDASGVVTAVAEGTARIEASRDGVADTVSLSVAQAVSYVEISPRDRTFNAAGQTQGFTAEAFDAGANPVTRVTTFSWATSDAGVVSVAPTAGASTVATSGVDGSADVTATAEGVQGRAPVRVDSEVASVAVSPRTPRTLTSFGETLELSAVTRDILGNPVSAPVTWTAVDPAVATVDPATGVVTARGNGTTEIVATSEGHTDRVTVTVAQQAAYVVVTPGGHVFEVLGDTLTFSAETFDALDQPLASPPPVSWSTSDGSVVAVDAATGLATAAGDGTGTVTATAGGLTGDASVTVGLRVASVEISPARDTLVSLGEEVTFTAVARDAGGSVLPSPTGFGWGSTGAVLSLGATSGSTTTATALREGNGTVHVTIGGVSDSAFVHIDQVPASLDAEPAGPHTLGALGDSLDLTATLRDAGGSVAAGPVAWSSSDPSVVSVDPATGIVVAMANGGPVDVVATSGLLADTVRVTVAQAVDALTLSPPAVSFDSSGDTVTVVATAVDARGNAVTPAPAVTWSTSDPAVADVDPSTGLVTAGSTNGSATITGTTGAVSASSSVTLGLAVWSVEVTPSADTLRSRGATTRFQAVARDSDGLVVETSFSWSSSDPAVASLAPVATDTASATALADGTVLVSASAGGVTGTATLVVARVPASVTIAPDAPPTLTALGDSVHLTASVRDSLGQLMSPAALTWDTPDYIVYGFGSGGSASFEAMANGSTVVRAFVGSARDSVPVTVAQEPASVSVTPDSVTLGAVGDTARFSATVLDARGATIPSPSVSWSVGPGTVATVDGSGLVTAVGAGETGITAQAGSARDVGLVRVSPVAADVVVTPAPIPTLTALGSTVQLAATVEDGAGNPIEGATVRWTGLDPGIATVAAGGLVTATGNGAARVEALYRTELDTIADTVTVAVDQRITTVSVTPSSVAMAPGDEGVQLHAEGRDANDHPVAGAVFAWSSLDGAVATVSGSGLVTPLVEGSTTVEAAADGVAGTASVQVTAGEVTRTFTGTSSGDLLDPANWEPAGAPDADDELVLAAGTTATLSSDFSLGSLTLEDGATLEVSEGATLDLSGSLDATGGITGSGTVEMSGTGTITGTVPNLDVTGTVSVEGSVTVSGDLETADGGVLSMTESDDRLSVNGDLRVGGVGDTDGELTGGTIYLSGALINVSTSFKTFNPSGDHTVVFNGTSRQTVTLSFPGENQHRFQNVVVDNPAGVVFTTSLPILGNATIERGTLEGSGPEVYTDVYGNVADVPGDGWRLPTTRIHGAAPSLPASMMTNLVFPGTTTLGGDVTVDGDVLVTGSSSNLNLGGHRLTVTGAFEVDDSGLLTMVDGSSELAVTGDLRFGGRNTVGALSAGTIFVGGDFHWTDGVKVDPFLPSGSHRVVFDGAGPQSIVYAPGGNRVFAFQDLTVADGADVTPAGDLTVTGTMTVDGRFTVPAGATLTVLGALDDAAGEVTGDGTVVRP